MFWSRLIVVLIGVSALDVYSWLVLSMVGLISVSIHTMLMSLLLNLAWSIVFTALTYVIWGNLAQDYPFLVDMQAYRQ